MSKGEQIEVITYERERLDYFTELMRLAQTRYNLLHRKFKDAPYLSEEHQMLSDIGRETQFFSDVVEMLEKGYRKQSEGEWVMQEYPLARCSVCGVQRNSARQYLWKYCPNCGAKMKGV